MARPVRVNRLATRTYSATGSQLSNRPFSAANASAQLDNNIRAAAERARFFSVRLQNTDRLIERAWSFVVNRVQG